MLNVLKRFVYKIRFFRLIWRISLLEKRLSYLEAVYHERMAIQREFNQDIQAYGQRIKQDLHHVSLKTEALEGILSEHIELQETQAETEALKQESLRVEALTESKTLLSLKRQLAFHRLNLNNREELLAKRGSDQPLALINEIGDLRALIEAVERQIRDIETE